MRPSDLKSPFTWDERKVTIHDRVWHVPKLCSTEDFLFPGWSHPDVFGNNLPVCLEYCSGNGDWIVHKAVTNPQFNWVAVELKFERVRKIWSKLKNLKLNNLLIICGEGHHVTSTYLKNHSLHSVYINFPDPWPKRRHFKHRIVQKGFVQEIGRCLKEDGTMTVVTDDAGFSDWTLKLMKKDKEWKCCYPGEGYVTERLDYGTSFFESLWREQGKTIMYHQFQKIEV